MSTCGFLGRIKAGIFRVIHPISNMIEMDRIREQVHQERMTLKQMDADQLSDVGLSQADILRETQKSYYDIPIERIPKRLRRRKVQCTAKRCKPSG